MGKQLSGIVTFIFAFCAAVSAPAQSPDTFARSDRANVSALLTQFPVGGPDMRATIARIVIAEPSLAREVVALSARATAAQKEAIGGGLSDAASFFAKCGVPCAYAAQQVRNAIASADSDTRAARHGGDTDHVARHSRCWQRRSID